MWIGSLKLLSFIVPTKKYKIEEYSYKAYYSVFNGDGQQSSLFDKPKFICSCDKNEHHIHLHRKKYVATSK